MRHLSLIILIISFSLFSQNTNDLSFYKDIPLKYLSHPELKTSSYQSSNGQSKYELIHERTKFSKTFLNTNKTKTTIQSSTPMHYLDTNGFFLSIDYQINEKNNQFVYPSHEPFAKFDKNQKQLELNHFDQKIKFINQVQISFLDQNQTVLKTLSANQNIYPTANNSSLTFENYLTDINKSLTFYNQAIKSDYIIKNSNAWPSNFNHLILEEVIEIPSNFKINTLKDNQQKISHFNIENHKNEIVYSIHPAIVSDAKTINPKFRHLHQPLEAFYEIIQLNETTYKIKTIVDGQWLLAPERVFPITIDPVITIENTNVVNTCFFPEYQQNTMQVAVPSGETVLFSDINYDFIATSSSQAWMSEQRSFVSSVNGQTAVLSGNGNISGTFNYNINGSAIANTLSTGTIDFVFNFSRTWGGSSCNATFQFVNRRQIAVTYGTITYGDGPIFINEYSASNRNFNDGFGRTEDWIEIYNADPDNYFNLSGYHLSNRTNNPTMWQIQDGVIPPNSRLLIFCSERNISSGMVQHASFNLTQLRPDQIVLADPDGNILESLEMFVTQTNHSYGRTTDGADTWRVFNQPTPGQPNVNGFEDYTSKPSFDIAPGRYQNTVTFSLSSTGQNEQIRYTTNGSTPTASSTLYTSPVTLNATTVVRARAFSANNTVIPGFIETNTYFINENSTLPVFSFSGNADLLQLFNGNQSLEPIGHFEYFENDGTFIDENLGDFDKHGNDSWNYPQRGVDFVSRDDHGYKRRLEHQFFNTSNRTNFRRLMVKAAASDNFPFENGGAHLRDAFIQTLSQVSNLDLDERSATFVSLFVNGQYWGVYDLRERVDDNNYTNFYYGQDYTFRDSDIYLQFLKTWGQTEAQFGNQPALSDWQALRQYVQNNNMGVASNFNFVDNLLNIDSLIDYFVINSFVVSRDWLNYNTGWWRGLDPSGQAQKWRYILWDMDAALGHYTNFTGLPNVTATAPPCQVENLNVGNGHTQTLRKLILENPSVRQKYVTRYADLLNTHFSCGRLTQVFDSIAAVIAPEIPRQITRWGGNLTTWQNNVQTARNFITTRCAHLMNTGLASCYNLTGPFATTFNVLPANAGKIKMNSEWLPTYPFNAQVFGNIETNLKAEANSGFIFSHWEVDGAVISPNDQSLDIVLQLSQATNVTAHFIDPTNTGGDLIYYWHFNTLETPQDVTTIAADYQLITPANPLMTYTGTGPRDIDANNNGSDLNLHLGELAGKNARVRNPSENRSLVFDLPTSGYKDIQFAYAVERTNQGQLKNIISYSLDGINFIQTGLANTEFDIQTTSSLVLLDFSDILEVNNNPNFKIRISFEGNTTASNGNNRFDNITLKGVEDPLSNQQFQQTTYQIFPNPFESTIQIISKSMINEITVIDMFGKIVSKNNAVESNQMNIDLSQLNTGLYLIKINTADEMITHKIIKK